MELLAELRSTNFIEGLFHWLRLCCAEILTIALLSEASGRFARGTVLVARGSAKFDFFCKTLLSSFTPFFIFITSKDEIRVGASFHQLRFAEDWIGHEFFRC